MSENEADKSNDNSDGISVTCSCVLISFVALSLAIVTFIGFGMNTNDMKREILNGKVSDTYCNQYVLSTVFASFDCSGQVNECNNDVNCYTPGNIFGHDYCQDECVCCLAQSVVDNNTNLDKQASSIGTTFIVSIVFGSLHLLLLMAEIFSKNNKSMISYNILILIGICVILVIMVTYVNVKWVFECNIAAIIANASSLLYRVYIWMVNKPAKSKVIKRNPDINELAWNVANTMNSVVNNINNNPNIKANITVKNRTNNTNTKSSNINNNNINTSSNNQYNSNKKDYKEVWNYLREIGFLEYYDLFIQNGYESKNDLMTLTDNDLMTIGITKHLHRKKILNAINGNNNDELPAYTAQ